MPLTYSIKTTRRAYGHPLDVKIEAVPSEWATTPLPPLSERAAQRRAHLKVVLAVSEAIREARRIPAGTLYAVLCGQVDFQGFTAILATLKRAGFIEERAHELIWIGPEVRP